jgi:hypothetical protein
MPARRARFYVPATIALTVVTAVHAATAWAADDGGASDASADAADESKTDGGARTSSAQCGGGKDDPDEPAGIVLFGAGCC